MVAMEGSLKKRGANIPIMHDRYCVATWAVGQNPDHRMLLRTYKTEKAYLGNPVNPLHEYELKCVADWDGRSGLKRHKHGFIMTTQDDQVFQCCAPSDEEKKRWLDVMTPEYYPELSKPHHSLPHLHSNPSRATTARAKSDMDLYTFHSGRPRSESQNSYSTSGLSVGYAGSHLDRLSSSGEDDTESLEEYEAECKLEAMDRAVKSIPAGMKLALDDLEVENETPSEKKRQEEHEVTQVLKDSNVENEVPTGKSEECQGGEHFLDDSEVKSSVDDETLNKTEEEISEEKKIVIQNANPTEESPKIESPRESEIPNKTDEEPSLDKSRRLSSSYPLVYSKFLFTNPSLLPTFISESAEEA